jgi:hypothetical protein
LAYNIEQTVKKGGSITLRVQHCGSLEQRFKILNQSHKEFVHVVLPEHLNTVSVAHSR